MFKLIAIETLKRYENLYRITEGMTDYQRRAVDLRRARYDSVANKWMEMREFEYGKLRNNNLLSS